MQAIVTMGGGFLAAVLWFDLMFDVQVLGHRREEIPEAAVASIAGYYRRVTIDAFPMNRIVAVGMLATLGGIIAQLVGDSVDTWVALVSLGLAVPPIGLAGARVVRDARRLARREDSLDVQRTLARRICTDHLFCLAAIVSLVVVQFVFAG